ncbi:MAG: hypothetical protein M3R38_01055 [Actinomycetota bacterium]|nr:hypothetical protein [Actinomycetota bacterium]
MLAELEELFESPAGTPLEGFAQRLATDEELRAQVRERFEGGRSSGKFPLLSRCESGFPEEAKEMFLVVGWRLLVAPPAAPERPWDREPYGGNEEHYREDLYNGIAFATTDLRRFADKWLEELRRVGYRGVGGPSSLPLKQRIDYSAVSRPASLPPQGDAYPVRFENTRQVLWLQVDSMRSSERGYREVRVSDQPVRTDEAILAALTVMEGRTMDPKRLRRGLAELELSAGRSMRDHWREAYRSIPDEQALKGKRPKVVEDLQHHQSLDHLLLLLRHHRPNFDELPQRRKSELIARACELVNEFLGSVRKLTSFLEFGAPGRRQRKAAEDADRDVRAAVLRDVDGLTYKEIGQVLGLPVPDEYGDKGDHPTVRQAANRGRRIVVRALGEERWRQHVRAMRDEAERWCSLSEAQQEAESMAEHLDIPYEEALRRVEEEEAYFEERRRSKAESEND